MFQVWKPTLQPHGANAWLLASSSRTLLLRRHSTPLARNNGPRLRVLVILSDRSLNPCLTAWRISIRLPKLVVAWSRETSSRIDHSAFFTNERLQHHQKLITSSPSRECDHCAAVSLVQIHIERQVIVSRTYCVASISVNRRHSTPRTSYYKCCRLVLLSLLLLVCIPRCISQHSRTSKATLVHRSRSYNTP